MHKNFIHRGLSRETFNPHHARSIGRNLWSLSSPVYKLSAIYFQRNFVRFALSNSRHVTMQEYRFKVTETDISSAGVKTPQVRHGNQG